MTEETHVPSGSDYVSDRRFTDFPLSTEVLQGIADHGYETATPVQAATIEPALAGKDLVVRAKTGTGKTCAFVVPTLELLTPGSRKPAGIILAPTRELAQQIAEEARALSAFVDIEIATLVGGLSIGPQEKTLKDGVELIVGTPGRILDHIRRGNLDMSEVGICALDEADEMLSMGFYQDVTKIIDNCKEGRQLLLFSATVSPETQRLISKYLDQAEEVMLSTDADQVEGIDHIIYETDTSFHKVRMLLHVIDVEDPTSAIIFCNTREDTATVASFLDRQGLDVQLLSGELPQKRRSQVMAKVKGGEVRFLVATDVAARGIDISDLSHVVNYALPQDPAVYMHRTGRTGRIGKEGTAISLVGGTDLSTRKVLETQHKVDFTVRALPSQEEIERLRVDRQAKQIRNAMGTMVFESYLPTVRALKERPDGDALLAAALRAFFQWDRTRRAIAAGVDSLTALHEKRNEKRERKAQRDRDGGRGRGRDRDRGRGKGRGKDRGRSDRAPRSEESSADLDALLVQDDAPPADGDRPKKKRRRRRRKGKGEGGGDQQAAAAETTSDASPSSGGGGGGGGLDDLDALLSVD